MVVDDEEKANILNTFFSTVFTVENEMLGEIPRNNENPILRVTNLTQEEVRNRLNKIKIDKSPGPDGIHPRVLRELTTGSVPQDWRIANVVPIFKKGSKSEPGNYRPVSSRSEAHLELNAFRRKHDCALVIAGDSLEVCLKYYEHEFVELACQCPAVVCCRCSPTQKAQIVKLLQQHTGRRTCAIGDGGNDVSMIQAADCGIGIEGKEGKQASLAADFSITQFKHIGRLLMVHGRNSYKRSASLGQFVIHRGLIISTMQAVFSSVFYFASVPLYQGFLMVGYATIYTMFPVFSLVLDQDVKPETALLYPELYKDLTKGRSLSFKTFLIWVLISIYQGGILMYGALLLFESEFVHVVAISFTALILTELLMVALTIRTWHWLMVVAEFFSLGCYVASLAFLNEYFDVAFIATLAFLWKVSAITVSHVAFEPLLYPDISLSPSFKEPLVTSSLIINEKTHKTMGHHINIKFHSDTVLMNRRVSIHHIKHLEIVRNLKYSRKLVPNHFALRDTFCSESWSHARICVKKSRSHIATNNR
ncbi:unnamed protein product [Ranitomeya imitator]|uniref:P-type ATPase C-terminal domain-containing protein n=1 Tax=Ranitomeya imitator TaxID=111125 RepID=A0ABN9KUQ8_9NEOB|nr:unnamed protein product [Ranitomeya imitator]